MISLWRRSVARRGVAGTFVHVSTSGMHYVRLRIAQFRAKPTPKSDFDRDFGVDTDGAFNNATLLRDLDIASPNWINGSEYIPIDPERFRRALAAVPASLDCFTFVDFGCGKGRAVLLASELPFKRIVGVDFSHELIATARANWKQFDRPTLGCRDVEWICADFLDYEIPESPAVLYFYHPCDEALMRTVASRVRESLDRHPRALYVLYLTPHYARVWSDMGLSTVENPSLGPDALFANDGAISGTTSPSISTS